ncbi:MAG TPA: repressor LexA [Planctomycetes bacterium]|nr:repressor LexA [Planctomycetota bacterium]
MALPPLTRRQRDILDFFQAYSEENGISPTLEEIARHFGLNKVTIFGHVAELERKGVIRRAAKGISRGLQLVTQDDDSTGSTSEASPHLPILGRIAAGVPIATLESPEVLAFEELAPPEKDVYVLRVQGESMIEDSIRDGDLVIVERRSNAHDGETVVAVLDGEHGEEATLKRLYHEPGGRYRLQPANETMQPILVDKLQIRGVVIGVIRRY